MLDLLLQPVGAWWLRWTILLVAATGLLRLDLLVHPGLWLSLALLTGVRVVVDWPLSDNHAYLLSYWCLACGLALLVDNPREHLARNARWLIGLVFALATVWKLAPAGEYTSGLFFRITMLTDPRFESFARIVGGLSVEQFSALREHVTQHIDGGVVLSTDSVYEPTRFVLLAKIAAWWNVGLNAAIAVAFLGPKNKGLSRFRNELLLVFCIVTYAVATVAGFGWLLIAMAVCQTDADERKRRMAYAMAFVLILLYREIPWADGIFLPLLSM